MQNFLVVAMLLITPGIICLELRSILSGKRILLNANYAKQLSLTVFVIFGLNLVLKALMGNGEQLFPLLQPNPSTLSLIKTIASSLIFAVLWAFIGEMIMHLLEKRTRSPHESK